MLGNYGRNYFWFFERDFQKRYEKTTPDPRQFPRRKNTGFSALMSYTLRNRKYNRGEFVSQYGTLGNCWKRTSLYVTSSWQTRAKCEFWESSPEKMGRENIFLSCSCICSRSRSSDFFLAVRIHTVSTNLRYQYGQYSIWSIGNGSICSRDSPCFICSMNWFGDISKEKFLLSQQNSRRSRGDVWCISLAGFL